MARAVDIDILLARFDSLMSRGDHAGARRYAEAEAAKRGNAAHASSLKAAARVSKALEERKAAIRRAAEALAGKETTLVTAKGRRKGEVVEVTEDGITLSMKIRRGRQVLGETRMTVSWADLTAEEERRLARKGDWKATDSDKAIARAYASLAAKDYDTALAALAGAAGHPLAEHLAGRMTAAGTQAAYGKTMRLARSHLRAKRWKAAVAACEEVLSHKPDDPEAKKLLAEAGRHIGPASTSTLDLGGGVTMELVHISPGVFMMGCETGKANEKPVHEVAIAEGFYIGKYEVTRGQFAAFAKATGYKTQAEERGSGWALHPDGRWRDTEGVNWRNTTFFAQTDDHPVVCVSWHDAKAFCDWLARRSGQAVRLPTEAEWEYACRAGSADRWCFGNDERKLGEYAWYSGNTGVQTHPVGRKKPNAWGLFDVHGNAWEWVADRYDEGYYARSPQGNPVGPYTGGDRVRRSGAWYFFSSDCRAAFRGWHAASHRSFDTGFRVAAAAPGR